MHSANYYYDYKLIQRSKNRLHDYKKFISKYLSHLKSFSGISIEQIKLKSGLSTSTISRILNNSGNYSLESAYLIYYILLTSSFLATNNLKSILYLNLFDLLSSDEQELIVKLLEKKIINQ